MSSCSLCRRSNGIDKMIFFLVEYFLKSTYTGNHSVFIINNRVKRAFWSSLLVQLVMNPASSRQRLGCLAWGWFSPWPGNIRMLQARLKKNNISSMTLSFFRQFIHVLLVKLHLSYRMISLTCTKNFLDISLLPCKMFDISLILFKTVSLLSWT